MNRSFMQDQELVDRLMADDVEAFEELYRRNWYYLYNYSNQKLQSSDAARRVVRDIFIELWENRKTYSINFVLAEHLYTEVRKQVIVELRKQLQAENDRMMNRLSTEFSLSELEKARQPVNRKVGARRERLVPKDKPKLFVTLSHVKWLFQCVTAKMF